MQLCWSAIVKNEAARIERCVGSLLPHVDCAVVVDTGSTDNTSELLTRLFRQANKPLELWYAPFENFEQARNTALTYARGSLLAWDYLLLADADMELRVDKPDWCNSPSGPLAGLAYDMRQVGGSLSYYNRRLVSRKATGNFVGVTHEYLDVPTCGTIDGAWFVDHADGANRPDKFARDIALLEQALATETRPGLIERYHFYLAQSYFDAGQLQLALAHYRQRVALRGYPEECWYAQLRLASCLKKMGDDDGFVREMLTAYRMRPQRAESLYELAKHFRERGDNYNSLLFAEAGLQMPYPKDDHLFVDDHAHRDGLKEEFAICAYYDPLRQRRGAAVADRLALAGSTQAQANMFWYLQPLGAQLSSFQADRIPFVPPDGWVAMNPSVIEHVGAAEILVRTVNYTITPEGQYQIRGVGGVAGGHVPINTRNFIGTAGGGFREIALPVSWPDPPQYSLVRGFEDSRLFQWQSKFYTLSTVRELTPEGWCEQVLAPIARDGACWRYGDSWRQIRSATRRHEKNWMPWVKDGELRFVYRLGTLVDLDGAVITQYPPRWQVDHISGGSQVVEIDNRTFLAVVHEARNIPGRPNRYYQHRFVVFDNHGRLDGISPAFFFFDRQIEFCAGLALFGNELMVSFGVRDREAWTATMDVDEVVRFVYRDAAP